MGTPKVVVGQAEMWVACPPHFHLLSEMGAVLWE